ncbi:MAG: phenylacetate--CoA ligase [bacterium]|nr:phenylacetate--CoA ligase [bacterium]
MQVKTKKQDPKSPYFQSDIETMPVEKLKKLQLDRLKKQVRNVYNNNPYFKKVYDKAGFNPGDLKTLEDISKVPFMEKSTVRDGYPTKIVTGNMAEMREMHSTSGTTGKPVLIFANENDINLWADRNARELWMTGVRPGDIFLNSFGYGLPTGGFGFHYGAQRMGACPIPLSGGQSDRMVDILVDLPVKAFCATPSFALYVGQKAQEKGFDLAKDSTCKISLHGAEPWPWATRVKIEELFGTKAYDEFGMTEFLGPGMTCECKARKEKMPQKMHAWADHLLAECINPSTGEPVADGEDGEIVWTNLVNTGTPLIRYRSRDLASLTWKPCPCGRTHPRMAAIKGRSDDAVSISGLIVFPSQVEEALTPFPEMGANFRMLIETDSRGMDKWTLKIELKDKAYLSDAALVERLKNEMKIAVKGVTDVNPKVMELIGPDELPRATSGEGKTASARVDDRRKK